MSARLRAAQRDFLNRAVYAWWLAGQPPIQATSYIRTPQRNAEVGGAPESQHLIGTALDVTGPTERFADFARQLGLVVVDEGSHVHLQLFPAGGARAAGLFPDV